MQPCPQPSIRCSHPVLPWTSISKTSRLSYPAKTYLRQASIQGRLCWLKNLNASTIAGTTQSRAFPIPKRCITKGGWRNSHLISSTRCLKWKNKSSMQSRWRSLMTLSRRSSIWGLVISTARLHNVIESCRLSARYESGLQRRRITYIRTISYNWNAS